LQTALQAFALSDRLEQHAAWFGAFNVHERRELLSPALWAESEAFVHGLAETLLSGRGAPSAGFPSVVEEALYLDTRQWLPADLLLRGDRMTMAHSLELRCPVLDWRVVEFAARRLPRRMKLRGQHVKCIVRKVAAGPLRLPQHIVYRNKWGFKVPIADWLRGDVLGASLRATLFAPEACARGWYDPSVVRRLVDDHMSGRANHSRKLWILYQIELWHRMFVDGSLAPTDALPQ
jgi:asparagine synthase (glutamine-hydrolysing)